jgi:hypothetical protein
MQNAGGGSVSARSDDRNDGCASIVSELVSLIEHVRASMKLIEQAIAIDSPTNNHETAATLSCWMTSRLATRMRGPH